MNLLIAMQSVPEHFNPEWIKAVAECLTAVGVGLTGYFGVREYRESQRLKAADMLLEMEKEFRSLANICNKVEILSTYVDQIKPVLKKLNENGENVILAPGERDTMLELDRLLRFFYVCTVLNGELHLEQDALGRVYYYWLGVINNEVKRKELFSYTQKYYRRLHDWLKEHREYLYDYRVSGQM
jgi:hypothetical protein